MNLIRKIKPTNLPAYEEIESRCENRQEFHEALIANGLLPESWIHSDRLVVDMGDTKNYRYAWNFRRESLIPAIHTTILTCETIIRDKCPRHAEIGFTWHLIPALNYNHYTSTLVIVGEESADDLRDLGCAGIFRADRGGVPRLEIVGLLWVDE